MTTLSEIRQVDGKLPAYAWPGAYPIVYLAKDNGILCPARMPTSQIATTRRGERVGR